MAGSDREKGPQKPSEQRGGTTPDEAEAREKGEWAGTSDEGIVPAELGGSDAPREMLDEDPELDSSVLGQTTGSDEPATEGGVDLERRRQRRRADRRRARACRRTRSPTSRTSAPRLAGATPRMVARGLEQGPVWGNVAAPDCLQGGEADDGRSGSVYGCRVLTVASTGWVVGIVLGVVVIAVAAVIVITIVALATRIARQAATAEDAVESVRAQTDELDGVARINDSGVRILHAARALRKAAVGKMTVVAVSGDTYWTIALIIGLVAALVVAGLLACCCST